MRVFNFEHICDRVGPFMLLYICTSTVYPNTICVCVCVCFKTLQIVLVCECVNTQKYMFSGFSLK